MSLPTAPFAEHYVAEYIERFCGGRKAVTLSRDSAGNILIRVRQGKRRVVRPVCITAHLDHPGFVADGMRPKGRLRAFWRGGVPREYFVGARVRFYVEGAWMRGRIRSVKTFLRDRVRRVDTASIEVSRPVPQGAIGMWDLPEPKVRGRRIHARSCDDGAGVAAILCCIDELIRSRKSCDAYFLMTRAEEVGFAGAIAAARLKTIPRRCFVVAMETSKELPHARMGDGPILRVGDRLSAFTPEATAYCHRLARELERKHPRFRYQRKLMDGGACESTAFCTLGYEATGLCLALGNHHNVDLKRKRLAPEYIDLRDFDNVVTWFVHLSRASPPYTGRDEPLRSKIAELGRTHRRMLQLKPCRV